MPITLNHRDGDVLIEELPDARFRLQVTPAAGAFVHCTDWTTSYPLDLIKLILEINGAGGLCDEIRRDEDPEYVQKFLKNDIFAYFTPEEFENKTILEFGCGGGASTHILARMFPSAEITGVELVESALKVARKRAESFNLKNVKLLQSPSGDALPENLEEYDFVVLSAVYEHLFPHERRTILPQLWKKVRAGGFLFLNQTPNSLFPFELHTTMLPIINYLPDSLALKMAHRFSKRTRPEDTWEELLRKGIRGATEREILSHLEGAELLQPRYNGLADRIDLYYLSTNRERLKTLKSAAKIFIKAIKTATGVTLVPDLSLAFRKNAEVRTE
ncbi:MAG TPA: methyltransferase domain-containing protein [Pyrinomonadaceae bacterium]|jgi:2-polyprenyl-3-methyl-5-hydroxy-6-metoxy-1,4-benzoquinol methylase